MSDENLFPREYFARQDERDDGLFYTVPRKVVHIDRAAIATLTRTLGERIPPQATLLDLMSSWRTHLPIDLLEPAWVDGLGLNAAEMADNPQLDAFVVHDLNAEPTLPYADERFDAVLCTVSVQYLIRPLDVFAQVRRVLKPAGTFIVSFSNRCFPSKATAVWQQTGDIDHIRLVQQYFAHSGDWANLNVRVKNADTGAPADEDPLYIVWAERAD